MDCTFSATATIHRKCKKLRSHVCRRDDESGEPVPEFVTVKKYSATAVNHFCRVIAASPISVTIRLYLRTPVFAAGGGSRFRVCY